MRTFILGAACGMVLLLLAGFVYVRFGFIDPRADIPINVIERNVAMPALDASVDRRAAKLPNTLAANGATLMAGMKIYQAGCASCHGDASHPEAMLAGSLYPRPPQFVKDAPDMTEDQNFYIIQHGVRLSGMPGWSHVLSTRQMWQVTTFLAHVDQLPPAVAAAWKAVSAPPPAPER